MRLLPPTPTRIQITQMAQGLASPLGSPSSRRPSPRYSIRPRPAMAYAAPGQPLGLLFVAKPTRFDSNPTEVQRAIIESSHSILPLKYPSSSSKSLRYKTTSRPWNSRRRNAGTQMGHHVHLSLRENPPARGGHLYLQGKEGERQRTPSPTDYHPSVLRTTQTVPIRTQGSVSRQSGNYAEARR